MWRQILERAGAFARPWVERSFVVITAAAVLGAPVMVRAAATSGEIAVAAVDTKTTPSNVALPGDTDPTLVLNIQRRLAQLGLYLAAVDGRVTRETTAAIRTYQRQARLKVDGAPSRARPVGRAVQSMRAAVQSMRAIVSPRRNQAVWSGFISEIPTGS